MVEVFDNIEKDECEFNVVMRWMYVDCNFYFDVNFIMWLSFGIIGSYLFYDGVDYGYYIMVKGIFEKVKEYSGDFDFVV